MHVVIVGSYGFANMGDEAILAAIVRLLRLEIPGVEVTVLSGDPERTSRAHGVAALHWRDIPGMFRAVEDTDLVICGGGGLFFDYWGCAPDTMWTPGHWGLSYVAGPPLLAALLGKPTCVYAVGVGPLRTAEGQALTRAIMKVASAISVRDAASQDLLANLGIARDRIIVTADPAFAWTDPEAEVSMWMRPPDATRDRRPLVGIALRQWDVEVDPAGWETAVARGLDRFLEETGGRALFIPLQWMEGDRPENDVAVAQRVLEKMKSRTAAEVLQGSLSHTEKIRALAGCDLMVGMRLHAVVFALMYGIPFVALNYDPKIVSLAMRVGQDHAILDLPGLTPERVARGLALAWQDRHKTAARLRHEAEHLRALALEDARRAVALLNEKPRLDVDDEVLRLIYGALRARLRDGGRPQESLAADEHPLADQRATIEAMQAVIRATQRALVEREQRMGALEATQHELQQVARLAQLELAALRGSRRYRWAGAIADIWWLIRRGHVRGAWRRLGAAREAPTRAPGVPAPAAASSDEVLLLPQAPAMAEPRATPHVVPSSQPTGAKGIVNVLTPLFFDHDGTEMMRGGAERYLLELVPIIRSMGYEVRVYQSARGDWTRSYDGIEVQGLDTGGVDGRLNEAFHTRVRSEVLTLYHAFYLAAPLYVPGSIGISHGVNWDKPEFQYPREGFLNEVEQILNAISNLACVVSVDTNTINWVRGTNSGLAGRFVYIPNFVDTEKFRPSGKRRTPTGPVTVLYPRRLYAPRGFWTVADVLPDLLAAYPHLMFHFVGPANSPREEAAMRAFTEAYPGRVRWTVLQPERMPEAYQAADITVIPTLYAEGTSLSCLEALASGNAVIATNVGGLPNLILDGYNGLLIDPTPQALRGALDRLMREPDLCRELARHGVEVAQHYRLDLWKERWRALLEEQLSRPRVVASAEALEALGPPPAPLYTPPPGLPQFDLAWLEGCFIPQSMQFMIDCLPTIRELIQGWPRDRVLEVLDVGTGSGAGANLLATLHRSVFFGVQMKVDALDISSSYKAYADVHFPDINYVVGDLFDLPPDRTWDLIICSHVIEHLADPFPLINEIRRRARHWAVFCAPFEEKNRLEGHLISITARTIERLGIQPLSVKVMTSPGWKHPVDERSEVVVFVLPGHGSRES